MIFFPVSQQPRAVHMISAWAAVLARTNKLAIAIDFISFPSFSPFAAEVQRDAHPHKGMGAALNSTLTSCFEATAGIVSGYGSTAFEVRPR